MVLVSERFFQSMIELLFVSVVAWWMVSLAVVPVLMRVWCW